MNLKFKPRYISKITYQRGQHYVSDGHIRIRYIPRTRYFNHIFKVGAKRKIRWFKQNLHPLLSRNCESKIFKSKEIIISK